MRWLIQESYKGSTKHCFPICRESLESVAHMLVLFLFTHCCQSWGYFWDIYSLVETGFPACQWEYLLIVSSFFPRTVPCRLASPICYDYPWNVKSRKKKWRGMRGWMKERNVVSFPFPSSLPLPANTLHNTQYSFTLALSFFFHHPFFPSHSLLSTSNVYMRHV